MRYRPFKEKWKFENIQLHIKQKRDFVLCIKRTNFQSSFSFYILKERLEKNENTYI